MRSYKRLSIWIIISIIICLFSACGNSVSTEDVTEALETKNTEQIVEVINSYQEQSNKTDLDTVVINYFKSLSESKEYDDFVFMENLVAEISDEELKGELQTVLDDSSVNKVIAYTSGEWVRRDYTNADGMVIDIKWADKDGTAIITKAKLKNNKYGFSEGDVKWKNTKVLSENELTFEDLSKYEDSSTKYYQGYAKIEYDKDQIVCNITSDNGDDYSNGNNQVWVKKDKIDKDKEILTDEDFVIDNTTYGVETDYFTMFFDEERITDKKLKEKVKKDSEDSKSLTNREIKLGDTRCDVIKQYGHGRTIYSSYKKNAFYIFKKNDDDDVSKGALNVFKQSKYYVLYFDKQNDRFMEMAFDSDDILIAYVFGLGFEKYEDVSE